MRLIMILRYVSVFLAVVFTTAQAMAADPFTVAGVYVDAQGDTAIAAQTEAISAGQLQAANILIERLTLPRDRAAKGFSGLDIETAAKLIRAMEIANEKRSASRYLGDITVAFNPPAVKNFLDSQGMPMIATQARTRLVLPIMSGQELWTDNAWEQIWQTNAYEFALTPLRGLRPGTGGASVISASEARAANMDALRSIGSLYGVRQILIAEINGNNRVSLTDVSLDAGTKTSLGSVQAASLQDAAFKTLAKVQDDWKLASVNTAENAVSMSVSVLYNSHSDWQRLQNAINNSSQIMDARLDALSKDGALMTITYGGDRARLANELSFKGVKLDSQPKLGTVLALAGRR